ncbi:hypothetical protein BD324DRAFT_619926 [Kockovaella imperatae]|uniref:Uncharacterized protein n=1 Tax=Kockovaella imperatae TaxID=4999 RepID=A0A1Y1UL38_9TREE|nr:hypothetical protein BD324DRAFT_619926 [Kockovaella imperatae]ORX38196.1 hypothetical protein BD324DRAFT_619926 [Kockovaella imperatae]
MPSQTDEIQDQLFARDPIPPLEPGKKAFDPSLARPISKLNEHKYVIAALHLANDDIHHCHEIAQANEGDPTANLLHATLHRREGDYWNSKYWLSRTSHPLLPDISAAKAFVDDCEKVQKPRNKAMRDQDEDLRLRTKQWEDIQALIRWIRENHHA